jgi:hypothetical protein
MIMDYHYPGVAGKIEIDCHETLVESPSAMVKKLIAVPRTAGGSTKVCNRNP